MWKGYEIRYGVRGYEETGGRVRQVSGGQGGGRDGDFQLWWSRQKGLSLSLAHYIRKARHESNWKGCWKGRQKNGGQGPREPL